MCSSDLVVQQHLQLHCVLYLLKTENSLRPVIGPTTLFVCLICLSGFTVYIVLIIMNTECDSHFTFGGLLDRYGLLFFDSG